MIEKIEPRDEAHWLELRKADVTSTEVAALFGVHPYLTEFELYHKKKNGIDAFEESAYTKWGRRLQDAIAAGIAEDESQLIRRMTEYIRDPDLRIGASYDYVLVGQNAGWEIKNVDSFAYRKGWLIEDGEAEAPAWIEMQVQQQLMLTRWDYIEIRPFIGGNKTTALKRVANPRIQELIINKVLSFWKRVADGNEPTPDFEKDAEFISYLYSTAVEDKVLDARTNRRICELAARDKILREGMSEVEKERVMIKAELLRLVGDAEKVVGDGFTISCGVTPGALISYERKPYRNWRINWSTKK